MTVLTTDELSRMWAAQAGLLPDTATLYSAAESSDGAGGSTKVYTQTSTSPCRVGAPSGSLRIVAEKLDEAKTWQVTLPYSQTLAAGQRLDIGGVTYRVIYVDAPKSWSTATRALIVEG